VPAGPKAVDGVFWQLVEVGGQPAEPVPEGDRAANFRLNDADHRVTGYGGVNRLTGPYELNGKALKFGTLAMTRRAGPEPLMRQESALSRAIEQTASWRGAGPDEIELLDSAGRPLARFKRAPG
jgi:heat shock protein HslJ